MKIVRTATALAAALGALAACSSGEGDTNQAAAAPAAEVNSSGMNEMMNDPSNPYAQVEMQMHDQMMAAVGVDPSDTWVKKMIAHHQGAIDMTDVLLAQGAEGPVREMAEKGMAMQRKEIEELRKLERQGAPSQESAALYSKSVDQMHNAMMAAKGSDPSETWIRKMIEHHRGGVQMSNIVLANNPTPEVRAMAQKTKQAQEKDIGDLEKLLRGETPTAATPAAPAPAAKAASEPAPPAKSNPTPKAEPKAAPKAEPKAAPKAEPKAAEPTCTPEHRAMGHC